MANCCFGCDYVGDVPLGPKGYPPTAVAVCAASPSTSSALAGSLIKFDRYFALADKNELRLRNDYSIAVIHKLCLTKLFVGAICLLFKGGKPVINRLEAAAAIGEVDCMHRQTVMSSAYAKASPHLVLGGVIWTAGYVATGFTKPEQWPTIWLPLVVINILISFFIAYSSERPTVGNPAGRGVYASRSLWLSATVMVFIVSTFLLFQSREALPYLAFPALVMALVYVVIGSLGATRFRWIGAGMFLVMVVGLSIGRDFIAFWTAAAGGGGLLLGGLWMRKA